MKPLFAFVVGVGVVSLACCIAFIYALCRAAYEGDRMGKDK